MSVSLYASLLIEHLVSGFWLVKDDFVLRLVVAQKHIVSRGREVVCRYPFLGVYRYLGIDIALS